jgi:hypothetical protein
MDFDKIVERVLLNEGKFIKDLRPEEIRNIKFRRADTDYIYFPDRVELRKKSKSSNQPAGRDVDYEYAGHHQHAKEAGLEKWDKMYIVIGHQLANFVPIKREDRNTWYFVDDSDDVDDRGFEVYAGNEIDKYNIDQEAKDAWTGIVNEI